MVNIVEVNDNEDWSDSSSVASSLEDSEEKELALYDPSQETIRERLAALKDMVPPSTRQAVADSFSTTFGWAKWTGSKIGSAAWIVTTSALVVGLPLMLSIEGEAAIVAQEKEYLGAQVS
jgi:mitochondrial import receptor subunit TOM22